MLEILLRNLGYRSGEFCVYYFILPRPCRPKWRNIFTQKFSKLITSIVKLNHKPVGQAAGEKSLIPYFPQLFPLNFDAFSFSSSHFLMPKVVQKARSISLLPSLPSSTFQPLWKLMWAEEWKEEAGLVERKRSEEGFFPAKTGQNMSLSAWPCLEKCYIYILGNWDIPLRENLFTFFPLCLALGGRAEHFNENHAMESLRFQA